MVARTAAPAGLALYLLDKHAGLPPDVITGLLLAAAAGKTGCFLLHNFRALAALRETLQQFLLLGSLNPGMVALSFASFFIASTASMGTHLPGCGRAPSWRYSGNCFTTA